MTLNSVCFLICVSEQNWVFLAIGAASEKVSVS